MTRLCHCRRHKLFDSQVLTAAAADTRRRHKRASRRARGQARHFALCKASLEYVYVAKEFYRV